MDKAKALTGKWAGEWVKATQPKLSYEDCKAWKLYCPTCYQPIHLRKSKKRKNYFAHYDYEDKSCPERTNDSYGNSSAFSIEAHDQDAEEVETFIEQIFYGINPAYFQALDSEKLAQNSDLVERSITWFLDHSKSTVRTWIYYFCQNTGFLDWNNPQKEVSYIGDFINILYKRTHLLEKVMLYSVALCKDTTISPENIQLKFGLSNSNIPEDIFISLIVLDLTVNRLSQVFRKGGKIDTVNIPSSVESVDIKIPENMKPMNFKRQELSNNIFFMGFPNLNRFPNLPILVGVRKSQGLNYYIRFTDKDKNCFRFYAIRTQAYPGQDEKLANRGRSKNDNPEIMSVRRKKTKTALYLKEDETGRKEKQNAKQFDLELYIDEAGELSIRGIIEKRFEKPMLKGIQKILFNKTRYSILSCLTQDFISKDVAAKAAQLALKFEYPDLSEYQALKKLRELSK